MKQPLVTIGLPAYNRPDLLKEALGSIVTQTYRDLEIVISDDCSPGTGTETVVRKFMKKDSRIQYIRQTKNLGAPENHRFVLEQASGEYFVWVDEDDVYDNTFVETGMRYLMNNPKYSAWLCSFKHTDLFDRVIWDYPSPSRFTATDSKKRDLAKYLFEPKALGKASIFNSIFRKEAIAKTVREYSTNPKAGSEEAFVLGFLARYDFMGTDEVLFRKRSDLKKYNQADPGIRPVPFRKPLRSYKLKHFASALREHYLAVRSTPHKNFVVYIMILRLPFLIRNHLWREVNAFRRFCKF